MDLSRNLLGLTPQKQMAPLRSTLRSGESSCRVEVVWGKPRGEALRVRARSVWESPPTETNPAKEFISCVNARLRSGQVLRTHCRAVLGYKYVPWRGELFLDDTLRLGPPSQYPDASSDLQAVIVDMQVEGIGITGVRHNCDLRLYELRLFLSVVLGITCRVVTPKRGWVCKFETEKGTLVLTSEQIGHKELAYPPGFPEARTAKPVDRRRVERPGLGPYGITTAEVWVPDDIEDLWKIARRLSPGKKKQFLDAANLHLQAGEMSWEQRTGRAAFLVVSCEALKPRGRKYKDARIYDVVASFLGQATARALKALSPGPQKVRSEYLHRGELGGSLITALLLEDVFRDPSFDNMIRSLGWVVRACLVEWLRCEGEYEFEWFVEA